LQKTGQVFIPTRRRLFSNVLLAITLPVQAEEVYISEMKAVLPTVLSQTILLLPQAADFTSAELLRLSTVRLSTISQAIPAAVLSLMVAIPQQLSILFSGEIRRTRHPGILKFITVMFRAVSQAWEILMRIRFWAMTTI